MKNFSVEIKQINDDFSVFKYLFEKEVKYGICFNSEIEDLNKGILPEKGSEYGFITKTDMSELVEYHLKEQDMDFDLADYVYENDDLFNFYEVLLKENSFKKGYFIKVDAITQIVEEYYNKLPVIYPVKIEKRLHNSRYNLLRAEYLLKNRKDVLIDCLYEDEEQFFIRKEKDSKYINFYWFPEKKDWKLFKEKLSTSSYKETVKFLIEEILQIPLKLEPPEETRKEINADFRIQGQTLKINDTFGMYQYTYKVNGELFSYSDLCLIDEIPDFQKKLVLPSKITCKDNKENIDKYIIVKKEYVNKVKTQTADVPFRAEDSEYVVDTDYFMNLPTEVYFDNYVILKKISGYLAFPYVDTRTGFPMIHPIKFEHCNSSPVNCYNYDLNKIEGYLRDDEDICFLNPSDAFIDFTFYPNEEEWEKMCEYINKKTSLKGSILLQHFLKLEDKIDFLQFVLDEIIKLPKVGGNNND